MTHGVGALLGVAAFVISIGGSVMDGGGVLLCAAIIYSVLLILEYTMSTFYHALRPAKAKRVFKVLDHFGIYLLFASTYTPYCLVTL